MFRENVLIALTILITILALSYVILLTVYLQINEMNRKLTALEEFSRQQEAKANVKIPTVDEGEDSDGEHDELLKRVKVFWDFKGTNEQQTTGSIVSGGDNVPTANPPFRDDAGPNQFPYPYYKGNGYAFRKPKFPEVRSNAEMLSRMIDKIQAYELRKQMQEFENRLLLMNEVGRVSRTLSHPRYREVRDRVSDDDKRI